MEELELELENIVNLNYNTVDYNYDYNHYRTLTDIKEDKKINETIRQYSGIFILFQENRIIIEKSSIGSEIKTTNIWFQGYAFDMTDIFKNAVDKIPGITYTVLSKLFTKFINKKYGKKYETVFNIYLVNPKSSGGKKAVVKHTVKQLQAIASKNNIKITKKVDGKTVRLNKQGLIAKLKRYKLI